MLRNVSEDGFLIPALDRMGKEVQNKNGETVYKVPYKSASYNGLCFTIFETGTIILTGSLHKYFNGGAHNFNDFDYVAFLLVLMDLEDKFGFKLEECKLQCVEAGVNIVPPVPTNDILRHCFLHKTIPFKDIQHSQDGRYKQAKHSQYIVKIYNKALHYTGKGFTIETEILRFELKFMKMEKLNKLDIFTLADIRNLGFGVFKEMLVQAFEDILLFDQTINSSCTKLTDYRNPLFWTDLLETKSRKTFYKHKKTYTEIVINSSERLQQQLTEILISKVNELAKGI